MRTNIARAVTVFHRASAVTGVQHFGCGRGAVHQGVDIVSADLLRHTHSGPPQHCLKSDRVYLVRRPLVGSVTPGDPLWLMPTPPKT